MEWRVPFLYLGDRSRLIMRALHCEGEWRDSVRKDCSKGRKLIICKSASSNFMSVLDSHWLKFPRLPFQVEVTTGTWHEDHAVALIGRIQRLDCPSPRTPFILLRLMRTEGGPREVLR